MSTSRARPKFIPLEAVLREELRDPEFRYHFEQRALVHEVAVAVRQMREAAGLTQARLAALIGVSQPMIARVERGSDRRTPSWDTLRRIAIALGRQLRVSFVQVASLSPLVTVEGDRTGRVPRRPSPARRTPSAPAAAPRPPAIRA